MPRATSAYVTAAAAAVVVAVLAAAAGAASQALAPPAAVPAAGPSANCGSAVTGLIGCLNYITPGNPQSKPSKECCAGVKSALSSPATVSCLCDAIGKNYGIPINLTRAAGLPTACGGDPAAFSKCHIKLPGAPTEAPSPSSGSTPATGSPGSPKSVATRSPISATVVLAAVAAPLLSYYFL